MNLFKTITVGLFSWHSLMVDIGFQRASYNSSVLKYAFIIHYHLLLCYNSTLVKTKVISDMKITNKFKCFAVKYSHRFVVKFLKKFFFFELSVLLMKMPNIKVWIRKLNKYHVITFQIYRTIRTEISEGESKE